ncbi:MAG: hypothetical protein II377_04780 [Clostridia bacterium]|nr:hypothetical protein [Clostridia bacterium]
MKKLICFSVMLVLCLTMVCPAFAEESEFVPSIGYKDHPDIVGDVELIDPENKVIDVVPEECLIIVPIADVLNKNDEELTDDEKKIFEELYNKLSDGSVNVPYPDGNPNKVIRDLFYAKLICEDRRVELEKDDVHIGITLDTGVDEDETVTVMVFDGEEWIPAEKVKNNGDGTVTVVLDILGVVSVSVPNGGDTPVTGDNSSSATLLWVILMVASAAALVVVIVSRRKIVEQ